MNSEKKNVLKKGKRELTRKEGEKKIMRKKAEMGKRRGEVKQE